MTKLGQRYVQFVNCTYARTGRLFEGRFRSYNRGPSPVSAQRDPNRSARDNVAGGSEVAAAQARLAEVEAELARSYARWERSRVCDRLR